MKQHDLAVGKQHGFARTTLIWLVVLAGLSLLWRISTPSLHIRGWDEVDFALALERFDLGQNQPHPPGYPLWIGLAMLLQPIFSIENPLFALSLVNAIGLAVALFPQASIIWRLLESSLARWLVLLSVHFFPFASIVGAQPLSDGFAYAILWVWIAVTWQATKKRTWFWSGIWFGVLVGVRLSYWPFGLFYLFYFIRASVLGGNRTWVSTWATLQRILLAVCGGTLFVAAWVYALVVSVGSWAAFWRIQVEFQTGHFETWGNTAFQASGTRGAAWLESVERLQHLLVSLGWNVLSVQEWILTAWYVLLLSVVGVCWFRFRQERVWTAHWEWIAVFGSYGLWVWFGQNVDRSRHLLPLGVFLLFCLMILVMLVVKNRKLWTGVLVAGAILQLGFSFHHTVTQHVQLSAIEKVQDWYVRSPFTIHQTQGEPVWVAVEHARTLSFLMPEQTVRKWNGDDAWRAEKEIWKNRSFLYVCAPRECEQMKNSLVGAKKVTVFSHDFRYDSVHGQLELWQSREVTQKSPD